MGRQGPGQPSKQKDAREWLEKYIQATPKGMRFAKDIRARGALEGYGWVTLQKVKKVLGYRSLKREGKWFWFNPFFISPSQQSLVEATTEQLERIATEVAIQNQTRAEKTRTRARQKQNARCNNKDILAQAARVQYGYKQPLEQTINLALGLARTKPCDPPFTDEDVEQIVREVYGISKPVPKTADIEF
jgi:cell division protein FtsB